MFEAGTEPAKSIRSRHGAGVLRIGLLIAVSAISACAAPPPETKQAQNSESLRRNYCLGNVASLGTGLVGASGPAETKDSAHKGRRWTGWLRASASGKYEFSLPDSGGRIFINQQQIFSGSAKSLKPDIIRIELLNNRFYAITVETPNSPDSTLKLQWRRPDGRHETVPKAYLYAPVATVSADETSKIGRHE